ncbi:hypothetical protein [Ktedonospora formicarum]|uniref:Uncharacterized protein n=1 Tax=Ktedonospora formicarum TaxID=2778364 RepID=A0A8J3HUX5_9CHLR|nr:hypothetical protein [Ktedonospora formicarum]GHO44219.1 hypothetical protein KSX_23820 [Ktedonospora formicarum]
MSEGNTTRKTGKHEQQAMLTQQVGAGHARDIGTAGGGTIPHNGTEDNDNEPNERVQFGKKGQEQSKQHTMSSSENKDTTEPQTGKSIGGSAPGDPRANTGDRDPHKTDRQETNQDITDPMTSRDPKHVKNKSHTQRD